MMYSVVICSYNKLIYLKRVMKAITSIGRDIEFVLSDDGSTDGTVEWANASRLFSAISVNDSSGKYELCTVRNNGIHLASRERVVLLDADCAPEPSYFDGHDEIYGMFPGGISVGYTDYYDEVGNRLLHKDHRRGLLNKEEKPICPIEWMGAYGGNISFPKSLWNDLGGFDEIYNGAWGLEDADFAYMAHSRGVPINASMKCVARHMYHPPTGTLDMREGRGPNTLKFKNKHGFSPC